MEAFKTFTLVDDTLTLYLCPLPFGEVAAQSLPDLGPLFSLRVYRVFNNQVRSPHRPQTIISVSLFYPRALVGLRLEPKSTHIELYAHLKIHL